MCIYELVHAIQCSQLTTAFNAFAESAPTMDFLPCLWGGGQDCHDDTITNMSSTPIPAKSTRWSEEDNNDIRTAVCVVGGANVAVS